MLGKFSIIFVVCKTLFSVCFFDLMFVAFLGGLYGPLKLLMLSTSVHSTFANAFKITIYLEPLNSGQ